MYFALRIVHISQGQWRMPIIAEQIKTRGLEVPQMDFADKKVRQDPVSGASNKLDEIFEQELRKNFHQSKESGEHSAETVVMSKLKQSSELIFSRETLYRGLLDIIAETLPSLVVESFSGLNAFTEDLVNSIFMIGNKMLIPFYTDFLAQASAKATLKKVNPGDYAKALLFSRGDLEDQERFIQAKARILKEEFLDHGNKVRITGSKQDTRDRHLKQLQDLKLFLEGLDDSDETRREILRLKDSVIQKQSVLMTTLGGIGPLLRRLFRKYILGADRFVGSEKYLSDKDAKRLGSKSFTVRQGLGVVCSLATTPLITNHFIKQGQKKKPEERTNLEKTTLEHLDTRHAFNPKLGNLILSSAVPYEISRAFSAQDKYELLEVLIKTSFTTLSLFFGDRLTNGVVAKNADKELQDKYQTEPGILYEAHDPTKGILSWLANTFPKAREIAGIHEKTQHNKDLQKEAIGKYQSTFLKGFWKHSIGIAVFKYAINLLTKHRVIRDLKQL